MHLEALHPKPIRISVDAILSKFYLLCLAIFSKQCTFVPFHLISALLSAEILFLLVSVLRKALKQLQPLSLKRCIFHPE